MAYWNSGAVFNRRGNQNGFTWNSKHFLFVVRLNDTMRAVEGLPAVLARLALSDRSGAFLDTLANAAFYGEVDSFALQEEKPFVTLLVSLAEKLGILDEVSEYIVNLYLSENTQILEQIKQSAQLITDEAMSFDDKLFAQAYYYLKDAWSLSDAAAYFTTLEIFDKFSLSDRDPRTAWSTFLIGSSDDYDKAFDWLLPFGMRIDWNNTKIQVMPEAAITSIEVPSQDGAIAVDTVYKNRLFEITCFSSDSLSVLEKEDLKSKIADILATTKKRAQKLTVQSRGTSFDVKYTGEAEISEGPSFVKAKIPFMAGPYGYSLFPYTLNGSGLVTNLDGDAPLRVKHTITGPVTNPSFTMGSIRYTWNSSVPSNQVLVINHSNLTCYLEDNWGKKTNAMRYLTGEFQEVPAGESVALVASSNTENRIITEYSTPVLW